MSFALLGNVGWETKTRLMTYAIFNSGRFHGAYLPNEAPSRSFFQVAANILQALQLSKSHSQSSHRLNTALC